VQPHFTKMLNKVLLGALLGLAGLKQALLWAMFF
jgi:hypothetical protein